MYRRYITINNMVLYLKMNICTYFLYIFLNHVSCTVELYYIVAKNISFLNWGKVFFFMWNIRFLRMMKIVVNIKCGPVMEKKKYRSVGGICLFVVCFFFVGVDENIHLCWRGSWLL